jgi:hypothetical protein
MSANLKELKREMNGFVAHVGRNASAPLTVGAVLDLLAELEQAKADADRWGEVMRQIGGDYSHYGRKQVFVLRYLEPLQGADIMLGSVSAHFKNAIDAALQSQQEDVKS